MSIDLYLNLFIEREVSMFVQLSEETVTTLRNHVRLAFVSQQLTPKEIAVTELILAGCTTREIGIVTGNKEKTIKHHVKRIYDKFDVCSRSELCATLFPVFDVPNTVGRTVRDPALPRRHLRAV